MTSASFISSASGTFHVTEFFDAKGITSMENSLKDKEKTLASESDECATKLESAKLIIKNELQPKINVCEKKRDNAKIQYEKSEADTAKLKVIYKTAQTNLEEAEKKKTNEELKKADAENELSGIDEEEETVSNEVTLFETLKKTKMEDRPLGRNNKPTAEDFRFAVDIEKIGELPNMGAGNCLKILNFLALLGVEAACGYHYKVDVRTLRARIAMLLFPEAMPMCDDAHISPTSKAKAIGRELFSSGQEAAAAKAARAEAERKREREDYEATPATKKPKTTKTPISEEQRKILKEVLTPEQLEELGISPMNEAANNPEDFKDDHSPTEE